MILDLIPRFLSFFTHCPESRTHKRLYINWVTKLGHDWSLFASFGVISSQLIKNWKSSESYKQLVPTVRNKARLNETGWLRWIGSFGGLCEWCLGSDKKNTYNLRSQGFTPMHKCSFRKCWQLVTPTIPWSHAGHMARHQHQLSIHFLMFNLFTDHCWTPADVLLLIATTDVWPLIRSSSNLIVLSTVAPSWLQQFLAVVLSCDYSKELAVFPFFSFFFNLYEDIILTETSHVLCRRLLVIANKIIPIEKYRCIKFRHERFCDRTIQAQSTPHAHVL